MSGLLLKVMTSNRAEFVYFVIRYRLVEQNSGFCLSQIDFSKYSLKITS
ncbi:hypothetical protein RINTHM_6100 [Richelia intracellularis HM01]|nr:hypothetical protein RINTHM_6100 [Richelia intracellularis HM01]